MAEFYYPTSQEVLDLLLTVPQGFQIELIEKEDAILFIKFDMAVLLAIIKGCGIRFKILNPFETLTPFLLEILDDPWNPLWVEPTPKGKDSIFHEDVFKLLELKKIKISLLNENTSPIYCFSCNVEINQDLFNLGFTILIMKIRNYRTRVS
ncbi:MAG: hypothetical protein LBV59_23390 [Sphingobacterium sp.]|jgi:hypothetical protein|uniref:hypothetical protein n=1 Tax=Sphingobacterium sp. TaxID=341027 RepID=UPI00283FEDFB|nr:hypothetical protein [Sphingobacterium sp.]MDR3010891.1 hypothetical protein [Sphingobacterium sp.]